MISDKAIENLAAVFPLQYLIMFEQINKDLENLYYFSIIDNYF